MKVLVTGAAGFIGYHAARRLAVAAFRANDKPRVERAIATLRGAGMNETDHLLADDWTQRLTFLETGRLSK
jgi:nucleoside-diphosphate-sugar epimerase